MFFSVARLRRALASSLLFSSAFVAAREKSLFTSSVTYCAPPESILVQQFDIAYYASNQSIAFNISAASVDPNIRVFANLFANVYGMQPVNVSIDICSLFGGALCPLPLYTFNGSDSLSLPKDIDIQSHLPDIAYIIPDIEAFAQLTLTDVNTGKVKACLQTTLSNGWSTHQIGVEWTTGAIALLAVAATVWQSIMDGGIGSASIRLLDIMSLFQTIALSGLLALNFPSLYRSFTLNFAWSLGLFTASPGSHIQNSINHMRQLTGGQISDTSSDGAVSLVNRKLSPYNSDTGAAFVSSPNLATSLPSLFKVDTDLPDFSVTNGSSRFTPQVLVGGNVATVTNDSTNVLQAGIPIYSNSIRIPTENAFMTVFISALILAAILLGFLGIAYAITVTLSRSDYGRKHPRVGAFQSRFPSFARAWALRVALISSLPVLVFAFYQWTLKDSWLSVLLSVIMLLVIMSTILPAAFFGIRNSLPSGKWAHTKSPASVSPLTAPYRESRVFYVVPLLLVMVIKALVTAFGHAHGTTQIIIFVVLEFLLLLSLVVFKPYPTRRADILAGYLCITRLVCSGLMIAFAVTLQVKPIPRVAIGAVILVIFSIAVVVLFFNLLGALGIWRLALYALTCGRRGRRSAHAALASHAESSNPSLAHADMEKGDVQDIGEKDAATVTTMTGKSQYLVDRPGNPSPPSSASLSPLSTTTTSTLGEELPHRWSFHHSRPPSVSTRSPDSPAYTNRTSLASASSRLRHSRNVSSSVPSPLEAHPIPEEDVPQPQHGPHDGDRRAHVDA